MKHTLYLIAISLLVMMAGCAEKNHDVEYGAVLTLTEPNNDPVNSLHLWVFDADGRELSEHRYSSYSEVAGTLLPLSVGNYTFVAATNITEPFVVEKGTGTGSTDKNSAENAGGSATTDLVRLYIRLTNPSASPAHVYYGVQQATVAAEGITRVPITLNRALAEISFTIKNIPAEVQKATLKVTNTAEGFYPGIGKLSAQTAIASLGEQTPVGGVITFPMQRMMPVVKPAATDAAGSRSLGSTEMPRSDDTELKTLLQLTVTYTNGTTLTFDLEAPAILNGGTYIPEVEYAILRPGLTVEINGINGWTEMQPIEGEVLNPNK